MLAPTNVDNNRALRKRVTKTASVLVVVATSYRRSAILALPPATRLAQVTSWTHSNLFEQSLDSDKIQS